ncbi:hypothetical protein TNIN_455931 [Trichonephila inaurata madagascariensis]|uniref:Alpha-carbonic anhydrase domain-containing protein n=1 Tax=Trichonephila inaurata madagascariensis TaxID=2747483 RepID=A0A8X6X6L8_9ARAC|nr:hypothetical protein TNIN_455931 [Trichonephila inaurata madagascariensis]
MKRECPQEVMKDKMYLLRRLMQGDEAHPKTILANNFRPPQPLYNRSVRTNVYNHKKENSLLNYCSLQGIDGYSNASQCLLLCLYKELPLTMCKKQ